MEIFLFLNFVGLLIGFFIVLSSRKRYVKKSARLENENKSLKNANVLLLKRVNELETAINSGNVLNNANPTYENAPNAQTVSETSKAEVPVSQVAQQTPVASAVPVAQQTSVVPTTTTPASAPVVTPVAAAPVQNVSAPVAPVTSSTPVTAPAAPATPATPVARPVASAAAATAPAVKTVESKPVVSAPKEKKSKLSAIAMSFAIGVLMIIIAAAVFITATWNVIAPALKTTVLFGVVAMVWGFSYLTTKKFKIEKTGSALYILGSCLMPLAILGTILAFDIDIDNLIILALCSLSLMVTGYVGFRIFKNKLQLGISITSLTWLIVFLSMEIVGNLEGFVLGTTLALIIFSIVFELSRIKVFGIASEIVTYFSVITYIISIEELIDSDSIKGLVIYAFSMLAITASVVLFSRRREFMKYVAPVIEAVTLPVITCTIASFRESSIACGIVSIVFAYVYIAAVYMTFKKMKVAGWLSAGLITISTLFTSVIAYYYSNEASKVIGILHLTIALVAGVFFYVLRNTKVEKAIYALVSGIMGVVIVYSICSHVFIPVAYTIAAISVILGVVSVITKKIPFIYEGFSLAALVGMIAMQPKMEYVNLIPFVILVFAAYIIRSTRVEKPIFALGTAISSAITISLICENSAIAFVYVMLAIVVAILAVSVFTKKTAWLYESFALSALVGVIGTSVDPVINKHIVITAILLSVAVYLFLRFKSRTLRNVSTAIALSAGMLYSAAIFNSIVDGTESILVIFIYFFVLYLATVLFVKFKRVEEIGVDVFKGIISLATGVMAVLFVIGGTGISNFDVDNIVVAILCALLLVVTIFEERNYTSFIPAFTLMVAVVRFLDSDDTAVCSIVSVLFIAVYTIVGRIINRNVISAKRIDWLTVAAPFAYLITAPGADSAFPFFLMMSFYALTFIGRFGKQEAPLNERVKASLKTCLSIAIMLAGLALASMTFFEYPDNLYAELRMLPVLIAAAVVYFVIKLPYVGKWIWFFAVAAFVHIEAVVALFDGGNIQLLVVGILGIAIFIISFVIKNKSWFILSLETIAGIGIYLAFTYWESTLWWVYLLIAGVILITTATAAEIQKRKAKVDEDGKRISRFKEWNW